MLPKGLLKEYSHTLAMLMRVLDVLAILSAGVAAYFWKFETFYLTPNYVFALLITAILILVVFSFFRIYESVRAQSIWQYITRLTQAILIVLLFLAGLAFLTKTGESFSREWFIVWSLFSLLFLILFRASVLLALRFMRTQGLNERRIVIIGAGKLGAKLADTVQHALWTGFRIVMFFDDNASDKPPLLGGIPVVITPPNISEYLKSNHQTIDEIWIALPLRAEERVKELLYQLRHDTVSLRFVLNIFGLHLFNHSITDLAGIPTLNLNASPMVGLNRIVKAIEDRLLATCILVMVSPLLALIAIGVKFSSQGPILFKQLRHGWDGRIIKVYKFRTMVQHTETAGTLSQASILSILLTIFIIVGIHEFGHFIVARLAGIKVLRFSIGFGKPFYRWYDKKGTEYALAPIPLGGYVKLLDETEGAVAADELHLAFNRQPLYKRIAVILAGPIANFLLAFFLYWLIFVIGFTSIAPVIGKVLPDSIAADAGLQPKEEIISLDNQHTHSWMRIIIRLMTFVGDDKKLTIETKTLGTTQTQFYTLNLAQWKMDDLKPNPLESLGIKPYEPEILPRIHAILPDSPADKAGLAINDFILKINDIKIKQWTEALQIIAEHPAESLLFTIKRNNHIITIPVEIGYKRDALFRKRGFVGISPDFKWPEELLRTNHYGPIAALTYAKQNTVEMTYLNFILIGKMIMGKVSLQSLGGPITIFESAGTALNSGIIPFIGFLAFLSIAIGVINILPIPGLDGGYLLFYLFEIILGRPLTLATQTLIFRIGFIVLIVLLVQAMANDLMRL